MSAYYNEHDPKAAAWLRELIAQGHIAPGEVDERSITDVTPTELSRFTQCHFFAGIGGWSLALRLAGWPDLRPVWTGSCPCQPFSVAGQGLGVADERHLWPVFHELIRECRPELVFGEQVANAIGKGWLDGVSADLEAEGYTCGASVLGAHSVGAPHIRQRLYWVADAHGAGWQRTGPAQPEEWHGDFVPSGGGEDCRLGDTLLPRLEGHAGHEHDGNEPGRIDALPAGHATATGGAGGLADAEHAERWEVHVHREDERHGDDAGRQEAHREPGACGEVCSDGLEHHTGNGREQRRPESGGRSTASGCGLDAWSDYELIPCADGKARRIESGSQPLAHGIPSRVGLLRGYGNAIVPQVAAEFITAFLSVTHRHPFQ